MEGIWRKGILGVVVGDALGEPVQFESREEVATHRVKGMRGYGTFNLPKGSWTDDSSLTLALMDSINDNDGIDLNDIMLNFVCWLEHGGFTPYGYSYDIGRTTLKSIKNFEADRNVSTCGGREKTDNGNGSLMRIMPVCMFCCEKGYDDEKAIKLVHAVGNLTHAHIRANIACGLYYFMVKSILTEKGELPQRLQRGLDNGFSFYKGKGYDDELKNYCRLNGDVIMFGSLNSAYIKSSGYVVDTLEASVWSLVRSYSYKSALLTAVNLGYDTDTVGAVTGGLAGLYYGIGGAVGIPHEWIGDIQRIEWIEEMCEFADKRLGEVENDEQ